MAEDLTTADYAQIGGPILGNIGAYYANKAKVKAQRKMKAYRNAMVNISNAINQNALTTNTTLSIQQSARQAKALRQDELTTLGSAQVSAAAAGVKGNSVNSTFFDIKRQAGVLESNRERDLEHTFLQIDQQRLSSSLSAVQNQDLTHLPGPRFSSYLLKGVMEAGEQVAKIVGGGA